MPTDRPVTPGSLVERQIREAIERGEFDNLPGEGNPIEGLDRPYDPAWWARGWLQRERLLDQARDLRREALAQDRRLRASGDTEEADRRLAELDKELGRINRLLPAEQRLPRLRNT